MLIGSRDLTKNSEVGGVVLVTIAGTPADISPSAQVCLNCLVQLKSGTGCFMNIGAAATTSSFAIPKFATSPPIEVPVTDLSQLHFIGTAADIVQILWRN